MQNTSSAPRVAIACGGTGGHLFPGIAVANELRQLGCAVTLLISPKEVDQTAVKSAIGMQVAILPAVGLSRGGGFAFLRGFIQSYRAAARIFKSERPEAVLAMGSFTSAPPVLAGRACGAPTFLHESNTIPGRANRWLSWIVNEAFIGFPEAAMRLHARKVKFTGTPVRPQFQPGEVAACRLALNLDPARPVMLVTGGSQGASGLNDLVIAALPHLAKLLPELQVFHLTGPNDASKVAEACFANRLKAVVHPFFADMPRALGAASVAVSRAGASSLAELAAMQLPSILVPYPAAMDNHQYYNALAFQKTGAAVLLAQKGAQPELLAENVVELIEHASAREKMCVALGKWQAPGSAGQIAESIMQMISARRKITGRAAAKTAAHLQNRKTAIP
jgi:UDP-N-acetylglucosamine--N-acetylmuramyl-(pentapeptide) pyrophosphoryl-undecaprenol N-acetylglucosamine transferase